MREWGLQISRARVYHEEGTAKAKSLRWANTKPIWGRAREATVVGTEWAKGRLCHLSYQKRSGQAVEALVRILDFILSEMGSHWKTLRCIYVCMYICIIMCLIQMAKLCNIYSFATILLVYCSSDSKCFLLYNCIFILIGMLNDGVWVRAVKQMCVKANMQICSLRPFQIRHGYLFHHSIH